MASCFWKFLLISVNSIVLCLAIPIFIGGALLADAEVKKNCTNSDDEILSDEQCDELQDAMRLFGYMTIVVGAMAILVCLAGICGACMEYVLCMINIINYCKILYFRARLLFANDQPKC